MATSDLKRGLKLNTPEKTTVGDQVTVLQVHLSLFPIPTVHVGYGVGSGGAPATVVRTLPFDVEELASRFPGSGTKLSKAVEDIVSSAYDLLVEAGVIGAGTRT